MAKTCGNCRYWRVGHGVRHAGTDDTEERVGTCRRYPQEVGKSDYEWCGEHNMRKPA